MKSNNTNSGSSNQGVASTKQLRKTKALNLTIKTEELYHQTQKENSSAKKSNSQGRMTLNNMNLINEITLEENSFELKTSASNKKGIFCPMCPREFTTQSNLKQHLQIHEKKDKRLIYNCHLCDKSYLYKCSLNKHIKMHASGQPMKDDDSFTTASALSEETLGNKSPKKVKLEEGVFTTAVQPAESFKDIISSATQNIQTTSLNEAISFTIMQCVVGGGFQNLKITIEPMDSQGSYLNERDNHNDYFESAESNKKPLQVKEECDFFDKLFDTSDQIPLIDYGFPLESL